MDPQTQRHSVPVRSNASPERSSTPQGPSNQPLSLSGKNYRQGLGKKTLVAGAIVALVALGGILGANALGASPFGGELSSVAEDKYQAVFLTNGQVYFGKIQQISETSMKIGDIYYLQQQSQEPSEQKDGAVANAADTSNTSLAKLGNELHGPEDAMYISREQVLFWENLKADGKVSKAISDYKKQ